MTDVCYVVSHGFAARTVLHSEIVPLLRGRGLSVAVVSPNAREPHFAQLCAERGAVAVQAPELPLRGLRGYSGSRRYLFEDYLGNAALRATHLRDLHGQTARAVCRWRARAGVLVNRLFRAVPPLPRVAAAVEERMLGSAAVGRVLDELKPKLVVSTYPVAWLEALALAEAHRRSILTVGQLFSWDNITCKGRFAVAPRRFFSWGPIMTEELRAHYGVSPGEVEETGVAHFDAHFDPRARALVPERLRRLGLDPARPYLLFGMSAPYFVPREIEVVETIAGWVRSGALGEAQLVVRPHPQNVRGSTADPRIVARVEALRGAGIAVDVPEVVSDTLACELARRDLLDLSALIEGAAVTLNSGSTLTMDALLHDKPVVLPMFDGDAELPWWDSVRRVVEFPHLAKLLTYGGAAVVRSYGELEAALRAYLAEPRRDAEGRRRAREEECGPADGRASERIAAALARLAAGSQEPGRGRLPR